MALTKEQFIKLIVDNVKSNRWINSTIDIVVQDAGSQRKIAIGVKAFGRWVQRLQVHGLPYIVEIPEQRTNKALKEKLEEKLNDAFKCLGIQS